MIPGYKAFPCFNMVQFEGICIIHLPDLLFGNVPGKIKDSSFVSAAPVSSYEIFQMCAKRSQIIKHLTGAALTKDES